MRSSIENGSKDYIYVDSMCFHSSPPVYHVGSMFAGQERNTATAGNQQKEKFPSSKIDIGHCYSTDATTLSQRLHGAFSWTTLNIVG